MSDHHIPVVDLSSSTAAKEIVDAAASNGFIFIKHTNILDLTPQDTDDIFRIATNFFAAPTAVKTSCMINTASSGNNHGYLNEGTETLDPKGQTRPDRKEGFNLGPFSAKTNQPCQPLPLPLDENAAALGTFQSKCHSLCNRILTLLAEGLEMTDVNWFSERHRRDAQHSSVLRLLHYPALERMAGGEDIRAGAHSDYGSITLLFRLPGQPGLEILTKNGEWVEVPVDPSESDKDGDVSLDGKDSRHKGSTPILVNIGDVLSYWTSGVLKSTVHRVVFPMDAPSAERYSIAYFCQPDDEAELSQIPSPVVQRAASSSVNGVEGIDGVRTAKDHLNARLAATYNIN